MQTPLFEIHPWKIVRHGLPADIRLMESLTSIGNGYMGMRGNFEEGFSGDCHQGTYIAGVWFPDKTRVGWWKNEHVKKSAHPKLMKNTPFNPRGSNAAALAGGSGAGSPRAFSCLRRHCVLVEQFPFH